MADGDGTAADLDVADRSFAGANAVQEILLVAAAVVEPDGVVAQRLLAQRFRRGFELAPVHKDFSVLADEQHPAATAVVDHLHAVGVEIPQTGGRLRILGRDDFHRPALVHAQTPLRDVEMMRAPVGHHAARVFAVTAPVREMVVDAARAEHGVVRPLRRRPEPEIPVETRLQGFLRQIAPFAGRADADDDVLDLAQPPVAHEFAGLAKFTGRTLHAARLEHPVVAAHGVHHRARLGDRQRQRLLAIDVLLRVGRGDHVQRVPVIRRGDDHGVNVLAREQIAEILVLRASLERTLVRLFAVVILHQFFGVLTARGIHIAHGHHLRFLAVQEPIEQAAILFAHADETERDPVAGTLGGRPGEARTDQRRGERQRGGGFEELAAGEVVVRVHEIWQPAFPVKAS